MPHRANTDTNIANGTRPNQNFGKHFTKLRTPTAFLKIPKFQNPKKKTAKYKTKEIYLPFALSQALHSSFPGDSCPRKSSWFAFDSDIPTNLHN